MADDLRLRVVASTIGGNGIAKLDSDSMAALNLADGVAVLVSYGAKTLELAAKSDSVYSPATVRLMKADMTELRVEPGMEVTVSRKECKPPVKPGPKGKPRAGKPAKPRKKGKSKTASLDKY
jgi:hypothetical protein